MGHPWSHRGFPRCLKAGAACLTRGLAVSLAGTAMLLRAGLMGPPSHAAPVPIGLGFLNNAAVPLWVAVDAGIFAKHGLDVQIVMFRGGTQSLQALLAGQVAMLLSALPEALSAAAQGADVVQVATVHARMPFALVVRPEIRSVQDLRGKPVGVSGLGLSASRLAIAIALRQLGVDPRRDGIAFIPAGTEPERLAALASGSIYAAVFNTVPYARLAEERGLRVLYDLGSIGIPWEQAGVVTTRRFLSSQPERALTVVRALLEARSFIVNPVNRERVVATIQRRLNLERSEAEESYRDVLGFIPAKLYPNRQALRAMIEAGLELVPDLARVNVDRFVEPSLLEQLENAGVVTSP